MKPKISFTDVAVFVAVVGLILGPEAVPAAPTGKITIALGSEPTTLDPQLRDVEDPAPHVQESSLRP